MIWKGRESFNQDYSYRRNTQTLILMLIFPVIAIFMCNFFITYRGNVLSAKDSLRIIKSNKRPVCKAHGNAPAPVPVTLSIYH